jgi:hypothetical protein
MGTIIFNGNHILRGHLSSSHCSLPSLLIGPELDSVQRSKYFEFLILVFLTASTTTRVIL